MPVPPELLEESGLPQRNIDRGPEEAYETPEAPKSVGKTAVNPQPDEEAGDLKPRLIGGEQERGAELKPQLQGGDGFTQGKALKPKLIGIGEDEAGEALKPKLIGGEEQAGSGAKVRAVLQDSSADANDGNSEKLVFCPNCGMHMQHDPNRCEACGMPLGNKPNNVPAASSGIPLFNTGSDPFADSFGAGGFGGFGGGFNGISDADVSRIDNFVNNISDPMFNSGSSAFNVQATPDDFAQLTEQLANFSAAAGMPTIEVTKNTLIRQKEPEKGEEREVSDFLMSDDLSSESVPISDESVPVVGNYSMEENSGEDVVIDPYAFINMSMDEETQTLSKYEEQPINDAAEKLPETVPVHQPSEAVPVIDNSRFDPVQPPSFSETAPEEIPPFIAEESPVIAELLSPIYAGPENLESNTVKTIPTDIADASTKPAVSERSANPPSKQAEEQAEGERWGQTEKSSQLAQSAQSVQLTQPVQRTQPADSVQPSETAAKPAENTKKCYACGWKMPSADKFCPNCGRSMYGAPNPNLMNRAPAPAPAKKKPIALIIVLIVLVAAAIVAFIALKGNAAEIYLDEFSQAVSNTEQTFARIITKYFTL